MKSGGNGSNICDDFGDYGGGGGGGIGSGLGGALSSSSNAGNSLGNAGSSSENRILVQQIIDLRRKLDDDHQSYKRKLQHYQESQQKQAQLVSKLQQKVLQYKAKCNELELNLDSKNVEVERIKVSQPGDRLGFQVVWDILRACLFLFQIAEPTTGPRKVQRRRGRSLRH